MEGRILKTTFDPRDSLGESDRISVLNNGSQLADDIFAARGFGEDTAPCGKEMAPRQGLGAGVALKAVGVALGLVPVFEIE